MLTECPHCQWSGDVSEEYFGTEAECPQCDNAFIVEEKKAALKKRKNVKVGAARSRSASGVRSGSRNKVAFSSRSSSRSRDDEDDYDDYEDDYDDNYVDGDRNPYAAPRSRTRRRQKNIHYGGMKRLPYFLYNFASGVVMMLIMFIMFASVIKALSSGNSELAYKVIMGSLGGIMMLGVLGLGISIFLMVLRLRNIGYNPWLSVLSVVPIASLIISVICLALPEGYADHKKMDTPAKVVIGIIGGLFALYIILGMASAAL